MRSRFILGLLTVVVAASLAASAPAGERLKATRAQYYNWHGNYYDPAWGAPVALVVPPTAKRQYNWGWNVGTTRLTRINHQFGRTYLGPGVSGGPFSPMPPWPWDTTQSGHYYVRGPW